MQVKLLIPRFIEPHFVEGERLFEMFRIVYTSN